VTIGPVELGQRAQGEHEADIGRPRDVEQRAAGDPQSERAQHQPTLAEQADQDAGGGGAGHGAEQAHHHERPGQPLVADIMSEVVDDRAVPECRKRHEQNADAEQDEPRAVAQQIGGVLQHVRALVEGRVYALARRGERDHEQDEG